MQDKIKLDHYYEYILSRLNHWIEKQSSARYKYSCEKYKYEGKFLPRLFKWKYENSLAGDISWCSHNNWYFYDSQIENCRNELNRCEYLVKSGETHCTVNLVFNQDSFYNYCKDNIFLTEIE